MPGPELIGISSNIVYLYPSGDGRLALRWRLRAVWKHRCKGQCLHQCKRRCDGASRGDNGPGTAAALVRGAEAGDRRRELGAGCGGQRCGAPRRYRHWPALSLAKGIPRRRGRFCAGADRAARDTRGASGGWLSRRSSWSSPASCGCGYRARFRRIWRWQWSRRCRGDDPGSIGGWRSATPTCGAA